MGQFDHDQLRALSPFLVKDTPVLMYKGGALSKGTISLSAEENEDFKKTATDWEKNNCPLLTGNNTWQIITDEEGSVLAYASILNITGVFHLQFRNIDGEVLSDKTVAEKGLEPDALGDAAASTVLTLGAGLAFKAIGMGIAKMAASTGVAAGIRIVSLAVTRLVAGEVTEGVVVTALRSLRAQNIVKSLAANGEKIIVNVGYEKGPEEVLKWGSNQIGLNHQVRMGITKRYIPNLIKENGEKIGEIFLPNTVDKIVSRRLDAFFDAQKFARGAYRVLKPGGTIEMEIFPKAQFAEEFVSAMQAAGFKEVRNEFVVKFMAVK